MKTKFKSFLATAIICIGALPVTLHAQSNWVDFNNEPSRMQFDTDDPEEKDITVGDLDNDGDDDVLVVRKFPFSSPGARSNLLLVNEDGILVDRTLEYMPTFATVPDDSRDVRLLDANNDGWMDIVTVTTFSDTPRLYINQCANENGAWQGYVDVPNWFSPAFPIGPKFCAVGVGDINEDGFDDLFFVDYDNSLDNRLLINNQDGTFTDETSTRLSNSIANVGFGTSAAIVDFNGDGFNDILVLESGLMRFLRNDGTGTFLNNSQVQTLANTAVYMFELADFNNDGRPDVYITDDGQDYVIYNNSTNANGTVNTTVVTHTNSSRTTGFNGNTHPADVDNDGWIDMGVCDVDVDIPGCNRTYAVLRNNTTGLTDPNNNITLSWNVNGSHDMGWLDINCDGRLDMFVADCDTYYMFVQEHKVLLGDVNRDGSINLLDVSAFIDVLASSGCNAQADTNGDGENNLLDVPSFVDLLGS